MAANVDVDLIDRCIKEDRLEELQKAVQAYSNNYNQIRLTQRNDTLLHRACQHGNERICRVLVEQMGINTQVNNNEGQTPLWVAVENDHLPVVKLLIEDLHCHANINRQDRRNVTPQQIARKNRLVLVEQYLNKPLQLQLPNESVDELLWHLRVLYPKHNKNVLLELTDKFGIDTETIEAYLDSQWESLIEDWGEVCRCSEAMSKYILKDLSRRWKLNEEIIHKVFLGDDLTLKEAVATYMNGYCPACVHERIWERKIACNLPNVEVLRNRFYDVKGSKTINDGSGDLRQESLRELMIPRDVFNIPGVGLGENNKEHPSAVDSPWLEPFNDSASMTTYDPDSSISECEWTFDGTICTSDLFLGEDGSLVVFWDDVSHLKKRGYSMVRGTRALKNDPAKIHVWKLAARTKGSTRTEVGLIGEDFDVSKVEENFNNNVLGVESNSVGVRIFPGSGESPFRLEVWEANKCLVKGEFFPADQEKSKSLRKEVQLELKYGPTGALSVFLGGVRVIEPTQTNLGSNGKRVYPAVGSKTKNATVKLLDARECLANNTQNQNAEGQPAEDQLSQSSVLQTVSRQCELLWSLLGCYYGQSSTMSQEELSKVDELLSAVFLTVFAICLKIPLEDGTAFRDRLADQCFSAALHTWLNRTGESLLCNSRSGRYAAKLPMERLRDSNPELCSKVITEQISDLFELRKEDPEAKRAFMKLERICGLKFSNVESLKVCMSSMIPSIESRQDPEDLKLWEDSWQDFFNARECCVLDSWSLRQLRSKGYPESLLLSGVSCLGTDEELNYYADEFIEEYMKKVSGNNPHSILASFAGARLLFFRGESVRAACVLMKLFLLLLCHFQIEQNNGEMSKIAKSSISLTNLFNSEELDRFYRFERDFEKVETGGDDADSDFRAIESSSPEEQWRSLRKKYPKEDCEAMDELMDLVGMEEVKKHALQIFTTTKASQSLQDTSRVPMTLNFTFVGNPGTGKTTVGRIFGDLLYQVGAREKGTIQDGRKKGLFKETTATKLKREGGGKFDELVQEARGGVLFIDEAYQLDPLNDDSGTGKSIVDELLVTAENYRNDLTIILAGYKDEIEAKLYSYNTGMVSRFQEVTFHDFSDKHLRTIWHRFLERYKWNVSDNGEDRSRDISSVAVRRVSRHRGQKGFGNAREVRNAMEAAFKRATSREDLDPNNPTLRLEDVLGPKPSRDTIPELEQALGDLGELPGLEKVKKCIDDLVNLVAENYQRELRGRNTQEVALNRLFVGNFGTSREAVAGIYSRVLKSLSLISKGGLELKTASDFIGKDEPTTEKKTRELIELHKGKTILINDAHCLNDHELGKNVLNVLAQELGSNSGEDIAVVLSGYERELRDMLHQQTPALRRRFDLANAFFFEDHNRRTLATLFRTRCGKTHVDLPFEVLEAAVERLETRRNMGNFSNSDAVSNLFFSAVSRMGCRLKETGSETRELSVKDILGFEDGNSWDANPIKALYDVTMSQEMVSKVEWACKNHQGMPREVCSTHFVFKGHRGTGKRTVARCLAKRLRQQGFVRSDELVEVSPFDLCGSVSGEAEELVREKYRLAKSRVLLIDEVQFFEVVPYGKEALDTLKQILDFPEFSSGDLPVVILAGLPRATDSLLRNSPELGSYFKTVLGFPSWDSQKAKDYVVARAKKDGLGVEGDAISLLQQSFERLSGRPAWAHARDATNAYDHYIMRGKGQKGYDPGDKSAQKLTYDDVSAGMTAMLKERPPVGTETYSGSASHQAPSTIELAIPKGSCIHFVSR